MRILVIEDDVALNGILAKRLAEEGHSVDCCFDGQDGKYCGSKKPMATPHRKASAAAGGSDIIKI